MRLFLKTFWVLLGIFGCLQGVFSQTEARPAQGKETREIRVMSYNIRYGTADDGPNHWNLRKDWMVETIEAFRPDLLGTQETLAFQKDFLAKKLSGYEAFGVGRDEGTDKGEMTALFYRMDRFEKIEGGHFWLSKTPEKPGSKSWDTSLTRMVSWVRLKDKLRPEETAPLLFLNTHFDHRGKIAREESAKLIRSKALELAKGGPIIVTGDFNAGDNEPPYGALFGEIDGKQSPFVDTFRAKHPQRESEEGTFSSFSAKETRGARIDWIGCTRDWIIGDARIDRTQKEGRTPSDHFAVTAVLGWK